MSPFLVEEISEQDFNYDVRKNLGLIFESYKEAFEYARKEYYNKKFEAMADYYQQSGDWFLNYNGAYMVIPTMVHDHDYAEIAHKKKFFRTAEDAKKALKVIGIKNYARYILCLNGQPLYEEVKY